MELFIQVIDGQPVEHPIAADNLRQLMPDFDPQNPPAGLVPFERVACPNAAGVFERDVVTYALVDGVVKDVWTVEPMSEQERNEKTQQLENFANNTVAFLKAQVQAQLRTCTDEDKPKWQAHLDQLNAWVLMDPAKPNIPFVMFDGNIVPVISPDAPGSAPDVIG